MTDAGLILFFAACAWLGFGLLNARHEAALCRAENLRHGEALPLWPVWLVVTIGWPVLVAQRGVIAALTLHDCLAARAEDKREARRG